MNIHINSTDFSSYFGVMKEGNELYGYYFASPYYCINVRRGYFTDWYTDRKFSDMLNTTITQNLSLR